MKTKSIYLIIVLAGLISAISCVNTIDTGEPQFNIDLFEQHIVDSLTGRVPGFAYAINQEGTPYTSGADGFADVDREFDFTTETRMHVASISKTITTVAILKILEDMQGVNVDSEVHPYLPDHWILGPNVDKLTFRNLLTHKTGFYVSGGDNSYALLQNMIQNGLDTTILGNTHDYKNHNFALFRIIIPIITGALPTTITEVNAAEIGLEYIFHVNNEIFEPMDIPEAHCRNLPSQIIKYYSCAVGNINDSNGGDYTLNCGGYGWNLNVLELAAFNAHLRYNNSIIDTSSRRVMDDGILGWENENSSANGDHGKYLFHGGQWHANDDSGLKTCIMKFPNRNVEVALVMNCVDHPNFWLGSPRRLLRDVYDASWE